VKKNIIRIVLPLVVAVIFSLLFYSRADAFGEKKWEEKPFTNKSGAMVRGFFLTLPKPTDISCEVDIFENGSLEVIGTDHNVSDSKTVINHITVSFKDGKTEIGKRTRTTPHGKGARDETTDDGYEVFPKKCLPYTTSPSLPPNIQETLGRLRDML